MKILRAMVIATVIVVLFGLTSANAGPLAQTPKKYYNAQQKKDVTAWGAAATITWTDPPLNGGTFSDHRVAVLQSSPQRYGEIGWIKRSTGLFYFVTYDDGSGAGPISHEYPLSPGTHVYSLQYDPNTGEYWFYVDGGYVYNIALNFSSGSYVAAGGEVLDGVESMGQTQLYDLNYFVNQGGIFSPALWNGYVPYIVEHPYCNIPIDSNSFYDSECPYYNALPLILNQQ